jgi:hypothetical protein
MVVPENGGNICTRRVEWRAVLWGRIPDPTLTSAGAEID